MDILSSELWSNPYLVFGLALIVVIGILAVFLVDRLDKVSHMKTSLNKLTRSFNELDEQAKLIVKTDLELNKAQEELDKRLSGLDALQKISRVISTTLDENEIFELLNQPILTELGFEKYLLFIFDGDQELQCRVNFGYPPEGINDIASSVFHDKVLLKQLKERQMISSIKAPADAHNPSNALKVKHFVMAPILSQGNMVGIIFAGNQGDAFAVTEGDEELISIFADQISQSLENARLFEQVYRSSQMLELKVQDRTKQLSSALEEVQKISQTKSEFISAVSHELRTPLTSIKGYASLLITGKIGQIPEKVKERLEKINQHSDNLVKLINNLLDISRIESGRIEMQFKKQDLNAIIDNIHDLLTPQMKEKNIQFSKNVAKDTPRVVMDISQFERVFINLVSNAIKFTPENGTVTVNVKHEKKEVTISIIDTGIGIKEEDLPRLFNEFYRVENIINQNVKGSGLGLALAKKIIEAHKGRIWVTSQLHKGSTFFFTLPVDLTKISESKKS